MLGAMKQISCDCGSFKAELTQFPKNSPGRLVCYCDDCQIYATKLGRPELLDEYGGTEIVPVYPAEIQLTSGQDKLRCNVLKKDSLTRWSVTCCNTPIANARAKFPWVGVFHNAYTVGAPRYLEETMGNIRARIRGSFAKKETPFPISDKVSLKDTAVVLPFMLKGRILGKEKNSPFFREDGVTPISKPTEL